MRLTVALVVGVSAVAPPAASAKARVVDGYCSPSGDYCTSILKKADGTIVFTIRAFANYFGKAMACVKKQTRVCHTTSPEKGDVLYEWRIRWQGRYPKEGAGRYKVRWRDASSGAAIGPALYFRRG
jgi:hypothetical protein